MILQLDDVAAKSFDLHSLPSAAAVDSSAAFTELRYGMSISIPSGGRSAAFRSTRLNLEIPFRCRTDEISRAYVDETVRRADGRSVGSGKDEWAVPPPEAASRLVSGRKRLFWLTTVAI